ncbi:MAG: flagellin [Gemmatimonadota bacterium]|jgi:flagellin
MRINTNVGAITASRNVFVNNMAVESSMRKLSSGLRISRAGDDAAGLAIANKLRAQHRALSTAAGNAEQGAALLQIAEGAASTIERIIERQKELLVQRASSQNSTVSSTLTTEITTLNTEIGRIRTAAKYQGTSVFAANTFAVDEDGGTVGVDLSSYTAPTLPASVGDAETNLTAVNNILATIGAGQNRLEYTVQNLKSAIVNVRAAESTIRDADMAEEMATFTKNSILKQAAEAMLSQANQSSQGVLSLLR